MPKFGFSAFLKLIHSSDRAQNTAIRERLMPSGDGYDFHRSFRRRAAAWLIDGSSFEDVLHSCREITKDAERTACRSALQALALWRTANPGDLIAIPPTIYNSPTGSFSVKFLPDFGIEHSGRRTAVHIWNTKRPTLEARFVHAGLSLIDEAYADNNISVNDVSVLSLRNNMIYRLSDSHLHHVLARRLVDLIDAKFAHETAALHLPSRDDGRPDPRGPIP